MAVVVADSTPLNYLAALGDFELLNALYKRIIIPPAVYSEVVSKYTRGQALEGPVTLVQTRILQRLRRGVAIEE